MFNKLATVLFGSVGYGTFVLLGLVLVVALVARLKFGKAWLVAVAIGLATGAVVGRAAPLLQNLFRRKQ